MIFSQQLIISLNRTVLKYLLNSNWKYFWNFYNLTYKILFNQNKNLIWSRD